MNVDFSVEELQLLSSILENKQKSMDVCELINNPSNLGIADYVAVAVLKAKIDATISYSSLLLRQTPVASTEVKGQIPYTIVNTTPGDGQTYPGKNLLDTANIDEMFDEKKVVTKVIPK